MMDEIGNMGFWGMGIGSVLMVLFWGSVVLAVVVFVKWLLTQSTQSKGAPDKTPLDILNERYARGEIDREEYEQKKDDLGS